MCFYCTLLFIYYEKSTGIWSICRLHRYEQNYKGCPVFHFTIWKRLLLIKLEYINHKQALTALGVSNPGYALCTYMVIQSGLKTIKVNNIIGLKHPPYSQTLWANWSCISLYLDLDGNSGPNGCLVSPTAIAHEFLPPSALRYPWLQESPCLSFRIWIKLRLHSPNYQL